MKDSDNPHFTYEFEPNSEYLATKYGIFAARALVHPRTIKYIPAPEVVAAFQKAQEETNPTDEEEKRKQLINQVDLSDADLAEEEKQDVRAYIAACETCATKKAQGLIAKCFIENNCLVFGVPAELISDYGSAYCSHLLTDICAILGKKAVRILPYSPWMNGLVERTEENIGLQEADINRDTEPTDEKEDNENTDTTFRLSVDRQDVDTVPGPQVPLSQEIPIPEDLPYLLILRDNLPSQTDTRDIRRQMAFPRSFWESSL